MNIPVDISKIHPDAQTPEYKTSGAVAFDIAVVETKTIEPGDRQMFQTGLVIKVPEGYGLILASRSSNSKKGINLSNSIGIIDQDYCGPKDQLYLSLHNIGNKSYTVEKGERVAQGFFVPICKAQFNEQTIIISKNRGGFGTTG